MPYISRAPRPESYRRAAAILQYVVAQDGEAVSAKTIADFLGITKDKVYRTVDTFPELFHKEPGLIEARFSTMPSTREITAMRNAPTPEVYPTSLPTAQPVATGRSTPPEVSKAGSSIPLTTYTWEQARDFAKDIPTEYPIYTGLLKLLVSYRHRTSPDHREKPIEDVCLPLTNRIQKDIWALLEPIDKGETKAKG